MISNEEMEELQKVWQHEATKFNWLAENVPQLLEQMRTMLLSYQALQNEVVALRAMHGFQSLSDLEGASDNGESRTESGPEAGEVGDPSVPSGSADVRGDADSEVHEDNSVQTHEGNADPEQGERLTPSQRRRDRRRRKRNKK